LFRDIPQAGSQKAAEQLRENRRLSNASGSSLLRKISRNYTLRTGIASLPRNGRSQQQDSRGINEEKTQSIETCPASHFPFLPLASRLNAE
jgi:hypothetical protein